MKNKVLPLASWTYHTRYQIPNNTNLLVKSQITQVPNKKKTSEVSTNNIHTHYHLFNVYKQGSLSVTGSDKPH